MSGAKRWRGRAAGGGKPPVAVEKPDTEAAKAAHAAAVQKVADALYVACRTARSVAKSVANLLELEHATSRTTSAVVGWAMRRALEHHHTDVALELMSLTTVKLPQALVPLVCVPPFPDDGVLLQALTARCSNTLAPVRLASALQAVVHHRRMNQLRWLIDEFGDVLRQDKASRSEVAMQMPDDRPKRFAKDDDEVGIKVVKRRLPGVFDLALEHALITGWMPAVEEMVRRGAVPYGYMLELCAKHDQPQALTYLASKTPLASEPSWQVWLADALAASPSPRCLAALAGPQNA